MLSKTINPIRLQQVLIIISSIFVLENTELVHIPFARYFVSCLFFLIIIFLAIRPERKQNYPLLTYSLIISSIYTFVRGFELEDLTIKEYFSSIYSFYLFPLMLLIPAHTTILKFLKGTITFSLIVNIVCLFTLPFWLGSSFFTDQISRFLLSIAALSYFFLQPYLKSRKLLVSANFFLALILNVVMARRAESFFFVGILILTYIDNFKINPGRNVFYITLTLISLFFSVKYFQFGTTLISRYGEGYSNREFLFENVTSSINDNFIFLFGKGAKGTYFSDEFMGGNERDIVEQGYYNAFLKSGIIFILLFVVISIIAFFKGFYKSKSIFGRRLALFILLYLVLMFGHGVLEFSYRVFFLWFAISYCISKDNIELRDTQLSF